MNFRDPHKFALLYYEKDYTIRMRVLNIRMMTPWKIAFLIVNIWT